MRKMPEKWPMTVAARIDDTVRFQFFFLYQKNQVRVCFSFQSKEYWSKIKR